MFSDFWCKGTIKKQPGKCIIRITKTIFPQKGVPLHQNSKVKLKKGYDHADGWFIYTLLYI